MEPDDHLIHFAASAYRDLPLVRTPGAPDADAVAAWKPAPEAVLKLMMLTQGSESTPGQPAITELDLGVRARTVGLAIRTMNRGYASDSPRPWLLVGRLLS